MAQVVFAPGAAGGGNPAEPPPLVGMESILQTIGFIEDEERTSIIQAGLVEFEDFRYLVEKDIRDMADEFGKRTVANGRIVFGLGRTKKLTGVMHWIQDCYRADDAPSHENFNNEALFEALSLAQIRKSDVELVVTNTKAADPGKFKDERKWPEWEKAFVNYLSVIPGVSGIPLAYIVRKEEEPNEDSIYATFNERVIRRAPLRGQYYIADARRVHNLLVGFLQGENTEKWIRAIAKYQDGRKDMIALRRPYAGEGHLTRCISDAKKIQATLHYKTERALPFNKFLDSLQRMFTIFEEENEPLTERAKVDELLAKVQNSSLTAAVAQLRYQLNTSGVSFTVAANHLNSEVSQTPDYKISRKINATNTTIILLVDEAAVGAEEGAGEDTKDVELEEVVVPAVAAEKGRDLQHITLRRNGRCFLMKNVINSEKSATRKASRVGLKEPSLI
jgi:hypothetical protein